jgi:hypothetical protein
LASGPGQAFDPINTPGAWSGNDAFKSVHTQAPSFDAQPGLVGGGMDDRFDFQLVTGELLDGEGLDYIPGSYHAFGNNGTHTFNQSISTGTGALLAVLAALMTASDHLPVVADYQLPPMLSPGDYNGNGTVDAADYVVWRDALGGIGPALAADGNGNGSIDAGDYDMWRANFGSADSTAATAIPEPATAIACAVAATVVFTRSRRRGDRAPRRSSLSTIGGIR